MKQPSGIRNLNISALRGYFTAMRKILPSNILLTMVPIKVQA